MNINEKGDILFDNGISFIGVANSTQTCSHECYCLLEIDLNGLKGPNTHSVVKNGKIKKLNDRFLIMITDYGATSFYIPKTKTKLCKVATDTHNINLQDAEDEVKYILQTK